MGVDDFCWTDRRDLRTRGNRTCLHRGSDRMSSTMAHEATMSDLTELDSDGSIELRRTRQQEACPSRHRFDGAEEEAETNDPRKILLHVDDAYRERGVERG